VRTPIQAVRAALAAHGLDGEIREFPQTTRTAEDAARALGTTAAQIVKSLVFFAGDHPVLLLVSGRNRADEGKLGRALGVPVRRATAAEAHAITGFRIGGVPPLAHERRLPVVMDPDLFHHAVVWAAAGTPNAVFPIPPAALLHVASGRVLDLKVDG